MILDLAGERIPFDCGTREELRRRISDDGASEDAVDADTVLDKQDCSEQCEGCKGDEVAYFDTLAFESESVAVAVVEVVFVD